MKKKILVIEDNQQNLYLMKYLLEDCGYEVFEAMDGKEGIEMAASISPDLILLDIQLPTMGFHGINRRWKYAPTLIFAPKFQLVFLYRLREDPT